MIHILNLCIALDREEEEEEERHTSINKYTQYHINDEHKIDIEKEDEKKHTFNIFQFAIN